MATSTFTITFTFTAGTQGAADILRDDALLDYCKARSLPIFTAGVPDPAKVVAEIRKIIKAEAKAIVVNYRVGVVTVNEFTTQNALDMT